MRSAPPVTRHRRAPARRAPVPRPSSTRPSVPRLPTVDPRLRARHVMVRRLEGRRRLRKLLVGLGVVVVVGALAGLVYSPLLDVNQIAVSGAAGEPAAAIRVAVGIEPGEPLLLADLSQARAGVEALPWVGRARLTRELPGTLRVEVIWRETVGWVTNAAAGADLLDARGTMVLSAPAPPAGLPRLDGASGAVRPHARVAAALTPALRARTSVISVNGREAQLDLGGGTVVRLGEPEDLTAKVRAAEAVLHAVGGRTVAYIDVRVPGAPVTG